MFQWPGKRYFSKGFLDNYTYVESESRIKSTLLLQDGTKIESKDGTYSIKEKLLIDNYVGFMKEFYSWVDEDFFTSTGMNPKSIHQAKDLNELIEIYTGQNGRLLPMINNGHGSLSVLGCR